MPVAEDRTRFRIWAPGCDDVTLEIEGRAPIAMAGQDGGWFEVTALAGAGSAYAYRVAPNLLVPDPASRAQASTVHGASLVVDPNGYEWRQRAWRGRPWHEAVIQEVHVGLAGGFAGVARLLSRMAELGITCVELMPVGAFSGHRNWGYDGVLPYAPAAAYGTPDELKALVDEAHAHGLMILLDVVYNHFGPDGNYLGGYAPTFFHPDRVTPWGGAIGFDREPVARYFIDNAIQWIDEYRFDGLRLDAVHAIGDTAFLDRLAREVRAAAGPDRHVHLVLENEANDAARLVRGYDAQWNDDFHNVMHVLLTGETSAYYQDFADRPAERLARCLAEGFIYQGDASPNHDGAARGSPSAHLAPTSFVAFLQNHDQIGNRAFGDRLTTLVAPARLRAATGLLLLAPQIPLLFMGDEDGAQTPFLFFTDFHDELADAVRQGRRKEFAKFAEFSDPAARETIPDPNAPATFEASRPTPGPDAATWRTLYRDLLALRRERIVPLLPNARAMAAEAIGERAVVARWRLGADTLTLAINLGDAPVVFEAPSHEPLVEIGSNAGAGLLGPDSFAAWLGA
jgi:maltooligosyltrehalose trehalohydrolase